jgi:HEAT repeat protein/TolA-binding protein
MQMKIAPVLLIAVSIAAQEPPVPPVAVAAPSARVLTPPPVTPRAPRAVVAGTAPLAGDSYGFGYGIGAGVAVAIAPPAAPVFVAPMVETPMFVAPRAAAVAIDPPEFFQGRGYISEEARRAAEKARDDAQRVRDEAQQAREQGRVLAEQSREQSRIMSEQMREQSRIMAEQAREQARSYAYLDAPAIAAQARAAAAEARASIDVPAIAAQARAQAQAAIADAGLIGPGRIAPMPMGPTGHEMPPRAWAQGDPADSLYRLAQETMSKGDYRKAAQLFKELPQKYKYSAYAVDAMYWSAHALYRVGTTPDLQEALQILASLKTTYPNQRIRGSQADVSALQVRIAGVLAQRGMGGQELVKNALDQNKAACDNEEQQVRSAALNALMQTDPAAATDYANKILARKDDCSREMRRNAIYLVGNKHDAQSTATLISIAKGDPSSDVRASAINYLGRSHDDAALGALEDLMKSSEDNQVQREAVRALAGNSSPRARAAIKALVERNDVSESLRMTALSSLDPEHATQEDVSWLQTLYSKTENSRVRASVIRAMSRLGGAQNEKWFATLVNNENESIDVRLSAIQQVGQTMSISDLGKLYDQTGQRQLRSEIVRQLGNRREPESIDKLGEIAKSGTDPMVRQNAINALSNKKDERATKLLLQLIDRP